MTYCFLLNDRLSTGWLYTNSLAHQLIKTYWLIVDWLTRNYLPSHKKWPGFIWKEWRVIQNFLLYCISVLYNIYYSIHYIHCTSKSNTAFYAFSTNLEDLIKARIFFFIASCNEIYSELFPHRYVHQSILEVFLFSTNFPF